MNIVIIIVFLTGYLAIIFEHRLKNNKAALALVTGVLCWTVLAVSWIDMSVIISKLHGSIVETAGIIFFLLGAMTIVKLIESYRGFDIVTGLIRTDNKKKLLWIISFIAFYLSVILDNLTTTIMMVMLILKLVCGDEDRFLFIGMIVIAANAGGAWPPIGDVTTTMLWIGERLSALGPVSQFFFPSLANMIVPLVLATVFMKEKKDQVVACKLLNEDNVKPFDKRLVFFSGIVVLIAVPVFKTLTHLPPSMGILIGLGVLWFITELLHKKKDEESRKNLSVLKALRKMDMSTLLFFLGILLAVDSLDAPGILLKLAEIADQFFNSITLLTGVIGILSAVIDIVPLVAASMGMYPLSVYPNDHSFWMLLAYFAGNGGSLLIIGSAAGVAAMVIEKTGIFKYFRKYHGWLFWDILPV